MIDHFLYIKGNIRQEFHAVLELLMYRTYTHWQNISIELTLFNHWLQLLIMQWAVQCAWKVKQFLCLCSVFGI